VLLFPVHGDRWIFEIWTNKQMDKAGKGEVSLVDFKAALMERRLAIVQKDNERRQQKQQQQQQQQKQQQPPQDPKPPAVATDAGVDASTACVEGHPAAGKGKEGHVEEVIGGVGNAGWKQGAATTEAVAENGEGEKGAGSVGGDIDIKVPRFYFCRHARGLTKCSFRLWQACLPAWTC